MKRGWRAGWDGVRASYLWFWKRKSDGPAAALPGPIVAPRLPGPLAPPMQLWTPYFLKKPASRATELVTASFTHSNTSLGLSRLRAQRERRLGCGIESSELSFKFIRPPEIKEKVRIYDV